MIRGGFSRCSTDSNENQFKFKLTNAKVHKICKTVEVSEYIKTQQSNYAGHLVRTSVERSTKQLLFNDDRYVKVGRVVPSLLDEVILNNNTTIEGFCNDAMKKYVGNRP